MESYKRLIGKKIQKRRIEMGFATQSDLAAKVGVDQSQISRWESGANIPEGTLKKDLGDALGVAEGFFEMIDVIGPREGLFGKIVLHLSTMNNSELESFLRTLEAAPSKASSRLNTSR